MNIIYTFWGTVFVFSSFCTFLALFEAFRYVVHGLNCICKGSWPFFHFVYKTLANAYNITRKGQNCTERHHTPLHS